MPSIVQYILENNVILEHSHTGARFVRSYIGILYSRCRLNYV